VIGPPEEAPADSSLRERRLFLITCLGLLVFGGLVRLLRLGAWSLWADEVATLRDAGNLRAVVGYPVAYALIGGTVRLLGVSEFTARLVPAVAGAATVPVLYVVGRSLFSHRTGLFAALCLALSPYHIFFSQFARYYSLVVLVGLLAMWMVQRAIEDDDRLRLIGGLGLIGLAFWTHWSAGLLVPALVVQLLWMWRGRERPKGLSLANVSILFLPVAIAAGVLAPHLWRFLVGWVGEGEFSLRRSGLTALKIIYRMEPAALICAGVAAWLMLRFGDRRARWLLPYAVVPCVLSVLFVGVSQGGSRFAVIALPPVLLLAGAMLDVLLAATRGRRRLMALAVAALVFVALGAKCLAYFTVERGQRPRWREAVAYAVQRGAQRHPVVSNAPEVVAHYGLSRVEPLRHLDPAKLADGLSGKATGATAGQLFVLVEHVANVAPTRAQWEALRRHGVLMRSWPLRVATLDYSISMYAAPALIENMHND